MHLLPKILSAALMLEVAVFGSGWTNCRCDHMRNPTKGCCEEKKAPAKKKCCEKEKKPCQDKKTACIHIEKTDATNHDEAPNAPPVELIATPTANTAFDTDEYSVPEVMITDTGPPKFILTGALLI